MGKLNVVSVPGIHSSFRQQRDESTHHQDAVDKMESKLEETVSAGVLHSTLTGSGSTLYTTLTGSSSTLHSALALVQCSHFMQAV